MQLFNNQQTPQPIQQASPTPVQLQTLPTIAATQTVQPSKTNSVSASDLIKGVQHQAETNNFVVQSGGNKTSQDNINMIQERRFLSVRYKVYSLIIIIILFVVYSPVRWAIGVSLEKRKWLEEINKKIENMVDNEQRYKNEKVLFEEIEKKKRASLPVSINRTNATQWAKR